MVPPDPEPPDDAVARRKGFLVRHWAMLAAAATLIVPALAFTIWAGSALRYTYSSGQRVGFVQKFSRKGWICKTWEGELAMVNLPGSLAQIFTFTIRSDSVASALNQAMSRGQVRVELQYDQHRGVPTSCFGETQYFVTGVRVVP